LKVVTTESFIYTTTSVTYRDPALHDLAKAAVNAVDDKNVREAMRKEYENKPYKPAMP